MNNLLVVGIGEALWDVFPDGKRIGGAPANFAYHVSQFGLNGVAISAIGNDKLGFEIIEEFNKNNFNYCLEQVQYPTGRVNVEIDDNGHPFYEIMNDVAWDYIPLTSEIKSIAKQTSAVCFGSLAQRSEITRSTINTFLDEMDLEVGLYKIFDINLRQHFYNKDIIDNSLNKCNVLKINDDELNSVCKMFNYGGVDLKEKATIILNKYDLEIVILTCGANGSYIFTKDITSFVDTPRVDVKNTVGAGDSFTAAFISALLYNKDIIFAHNFAVEVSAYVCTKSGAMPKLPKYIVDKIKSTSKK